VRAIAVLGIDDDVFIFVDHIDNVQLDADLLGRPQCVIAFRFALFAAANGVGVTLDTEASEEIDALDVDALITHQARGEHGIEAAGDQGNGLSTMLRTGFAG